MICGMESANEKRDILAGWGVSFLDIYLMMQGYKICKYPYKPENKLPKIPNIKYIL